MRFTQIALSIFLTAIATYAQPAVEQFRLYDNNRAENEGFEDIFYCANGNFLVCGSSGTRSWLVRLDAGGDPIWNKDAGESSFASVIESDEGAALVGGVHANNFSASLYSLEGELIWTRDYVAGRCDAVIELKSGEFVLAGRSLRQAYITLVDVDGEPLWGEYYGEERDGGIIKSMRETEGGIVAVGWARSDGGSVQKIDFNGNLVWSEMYLEDVSPVFSSMVSVAGAGFAAGGTDSRSIGQETHQAFSIMLIDSRGELVRERFFNWPTSELSDWLFSVARFSDGGLLLSGYTFDRDGPRGYFPRMIRIDRDCDTIWTTRFLERVIEQPVGANLNYISSAIVLENDRIIACGRFFNPEGEAGSDGLLVRFASNRLGPLLISRTPEDSSLKSLSGDSIQFSVHVLSGRGEDLTYLWLHSGDTLGTDSTETIPFDFERVDTVKCLIEDVDAAISTIWHVTVTDLFISDFTPDTLNLTLRRGTSVDFSLDTVRYVGEEEPEYVWTKTNLNNGQEEEAGRDAGVTLDFPWSGDYTVEGKAYRGESSDQVTWNVAVRGVVWAFVPEALTFDVEPDSVVHFELVPSEPENESLSIQWLVDGELAVEDTTAFEWSFASRVDSCPPYQVSAIVADSVEADTVTWEVTVRELSTPPTPPSIEEGDWSLSPNPFNSMLMIRYSMGSAARPTRLAVYDLSGRLVVELLERQGRLSYGEEHPPFYSPPASGGEKNSVVWDASAIPAGVYLVRLQSGAEVSTRKVVLMR